MPGGAVGEVTAIRGRRVITPDGERAATVLVRDGLITGLAGYPEAPPGAVTLAGDEVLLPGLVDSHVHVNEPGRTEWEGFATATATAAAGGVTTIVDMPLNSIPPTVTVPALRAKQAAAAGQLSVDVAFWGGAVPGNVADLRPLHEAGVAGFKCFLLPSGVDEFAPLDQAQLGAAMAEIASFGGLLIAHAEDPGVIEAAPAARGRRYADFLASRPPEAEQRAITLLLAQARRTGCRTHIVHLASAAALPAVRAAQADGLPVTAETCPHYLTLRAEDIPDGATQFKCCPPIRDDANRDALWAGLLDGTIGSVVSDHSPCTVAAKRFDTGDFADAWGGIASLQLGLPAVWTEAARRGIGLGRVAAWMSAAPAALTGLADRGAISPGRRADFSVFAPDERFVVDPAQLRQRNPVTPYAGRTLRGVVRQTWLAGRPAGPERRAGQLVRVPTGGVPAGPVSTGPVPTGEVSTGPVPTGEVSTGPVPTGEAS
jgi:allantoinase